MTHQTLYVSDLDGTLLQSDATLSPFARQTLTELLDGGLRFTVASARSVFSIREILGDLPLRLPVISFNGGFISDYHTATHLRFESIDTAVVEDLLARAGEVGLPPFVSTTSPQGDHVYYTTIANEGMAWYLRDREAVSDPRLRPVQRVPLDEAVSGLTLVGPRDVLASLRDQAAERHPHAVKPQLYENAYDPGWWWLTFNAGSATKGNALRTLMTDPTLGAADTTRLVVFGDEHNDLEMFRLADHAVAVRDAVPALKAVANEQIGSPAQDAVVHWLRAAAG